MTYQPTATSSGERPCVDRWAAIEPILEQVPQPATLVDLGAAEGWFSTKASELGFFATAIEPRSGVLDVNARHIHPFIGAVDGASLRRWPRHDVVLALSVLHHFEDWRAVLEQIRACRVWALVEVPDPAEAVWMRSAKARDQLVEIKTAVAEAALDFVGSFPRTGRNGKTYHRSMWLLEGTVLPYTGRVFSGSGSNSKSLRAYADARLTDMLGYEPYPGSLNLHVGPPKSIGFGPPMHWDNRRIGRERRSYDIWPAWIGGIAGHVVRPVARKAHPNTLEAWAPVRLRDKLALEDGDQVVVDVQVRR